LIIDGIDQLAHRNQAASLFWLPREIPPEVRLILSTAAGPELDDLRGRGWPALEVKLLKPADRKRLIVEYLGQRHRKKLSEASVNHIASAEQTANPLYLRTLLEELRVFGVHEKLPAKIAGYLTANSPEALYAMVLKRFEEDYEGPRRGLVRDAMRWLWGARQGISESELLDLLGGSGDPLPHAVWAPLYLAVREALVNRSGLLGFFHRALRTAVERLYLPDHRERAAVHRGLADYFARRPLSLRKIDELPWQLSQLEAWPELATVLADPAFLTAAWGAQPFEVKAHWASIESASELRLVNHYQPVIANPADFPECVWAVSLLLSDTGHLDAALALSATLEARSRVISNPDELQAGLGLRGILLKRRGKLHEALAALSAQEKICRSTQNFAALAANLGNQAVILREQGRLEDALNLHREEEALYRRSQDESGLSATFGNQAIILRDQGDLDGAGRLMREQERICRQLGDLSGLQKSLGNQAILLAQKNDLETALKLHQEEEKLCRQLHDPAALQACLGNQALIYEELGNYDLALDLLEHKEQLCRGELNDPAGTARTLAQQARLFAEKLKQPAHALPLAEEADALATKHGLIQLRRQTSALLQSVRAQLR
jgi:hypothetical protein